MIIFLLACMQEKNEALRSAAAAASKGGSVSEARLQDRENYISSLQVSRHPFFTCQP